MANGTDDNGKKKNGESKNPDRYDLPNAEEILSLTGPLLEQSFDQARGMYQEQYGDRPTETDPALYERADRLASRVTQLSQPRPDAPAIGGFVPGNRFSVSTRGLSAGINHLLGSIDRERRKQKLFGDPERRQQVESEIERVNSKVGELRSFAEKMRTDPSLANTVLAGLDPQQAAEQAEQEAKALEEEASVMQEQLRQYSGVAERAAGAEREAQQQQTRVDENRQFKDAFIQTFGTQAYETAINTMRERDRLASAERRQRYASDQATLRTLIRERYRFAESQQKLQQKLQEAAREKVDSDEFTPNPFKPDTVQAALKEWTGDLEGKVESMRQDFMDQAEEFFPESEGSEYRNETDLDFFQLRNRIQGLKEGDEFRGQVIGEDISVEDFSRLQVLSEEYTGTTRTVKELQELADEVEISSIEWENSTFQRSDMEELNEFRAPYEYEIDMLNQMDSVGDSDLYFPQRLKEAWLYYNRIDPNAPPQPLNPNPGQTGGIDVTVPPPVESPDDQED